MNQDPQATALPRALPIVTWAMLVFLPAVFLILAQFVKVPTPTQGAPYDMVTYILLLVAVVEQFPYVLIERAQIRNFRKARGNEATRGDFFFHVAIMRMAPVAAAYVFGFIVFKIGGEFLRMLYFYPIGLVCTYLWWPTETRREAFFRKLEAS